MTPLNVRMGLEIEHSEPAAADEQDAGQDNEHAATSTTWPDAVWPARAHFISEEPTAAKHAAGTHVLSFS